MSIKLITSNIWPTLSAAANNAKRPAYVAVAYFGQGAAKMLPLPSGSRLVVDASEASVKRGQTCPEELKKLYQRGVRVYSVPNLHAKVFVIGSKAYIGSANVSNNSAKTLIEALIATSDRDAVSDAKSFVSDLCLHELGAEVIDRLADLYNPPEFLGGRGPKIGKKPKFPLPELPPMLLAQLKLIDPPAGSESAQEAGRKDAKKKMKNPRRHELVDFWHKGKCHYKRGDIVMQVLNEGDGKLMVSPPGEIVELKPWQDKTTFIYIEIPVRRRVRLEKLARRLDCEKKTLLKNGKVNNNFRTRLLRVWGQ